MGKSVHISELNEQAYDLLTACGLFASQNKSKEDTGASIMEAVGVAVQLIILASDKVKEKGDKYGG